MDSGHAWLSFCAECGVVQDGVLYGPRRGDELGGLWELGVVIVHCRERGCSGVTWHQLGVAELAFLSRAAIERADNGHGAS